VQKIDRDGFQRCQTYVHIYTTLKFLALQGAPYIYISRLRVNAHALANAKSDASMDGLLVELKEVFDHIPTFVQYFVLRQVRSFFHSEFLRQCTLVLSL
jgi:hypothetical protein